MKTIISHISLSTTLLLLFLLNHATAQVAWLTPPNPPTNKQVTLTYNSNAGNKALANYDGTVYFHTGAITKRSIDGGDWKHVTGNWGKADNRVKMKNIGDGLYESSFVIDSFYKLNADEVVQQLAFVFRSENGAKVGKTVTNEDLFIPVNGYIPPVTAKKKYKFQNRKYVSHNTTDSSINILTTNGITMVVPHNQNIIEVVHFADDTIKPTGSEAVIPSQIHTSFHILNNKNYLNIITDSVTVVVNKSPFYISFIFKNDTILSEEKGFFSREDNDGLRFNVSSNEKIYGLGERAAGINLYGSKYNLYNRPKYGYEIGARNLNYSVPVIVSSKKYMLLFDNYQKGYADIGESEPDIIEFGAIGGLMKYYFIAGSNYKLISKSYGTLTGTQPLPPLWALGNLQSRMAYRTQYETDSIVNLMQKKDFPLDAIILDFYWFGDSILGTMGRLDWYKPNWPQPKQMISKFKSEGVKTILITEPYILDTLKNFAIADSLGILALDTNGNSYVNKEFYFGDGALIDIFKPEARQWFWKQYVKQMDIGVAGWWGDLGEPENHPADQIHVLGAADEVHNIYAHYWHRMLFNNFRKYYPNQRLFNLNRAGFAGSQRYSIFPWTGDVSRSWGGLQAQIPLMINMSLSGLPFIHSDAGGFAQGAKNDELYTRWLQMACFSPILRPHGSEIPSEVVYFNDTTQNIVRNFMKLRYRLIPYIYTLTAEANQYGYPIIRPLFYEFPKDSICYNVEGEYMFGDNMLITPITKSKMKNIDIYLPANSGWYNMWTHKFYAGGKWITVDVNLKTIPIFIKSGSFIPMVKQVNTTDNYSTKKLTILYFNDTEPNSNNYLMFNDDGKTYGTINNNNYETISFKRKIVSQNTTEYHFDNKRNNFKGETNKRKIRFEVIGLPTDVKFTFSINNKKLKKLTNSSTQNGYYFDKLHGVWVVNFELSTDEIVIKQKM